MRMPPLSRRAKIGFAVFALLAAIAFFPLRLALDLAGLGNSDTITARQVRGIVWLGRMDDLMIGDAALGTLHAAISPVQLLVGRVRLDLWREEGLPSDIEGAWTAGFNQRGVDDVTGTVPIAGAFGPLPLSTAEFEDVTIHFAGNTCAKAEGRVRMRITGEFAGLNLSQGLSGVAACDGEAVLLPLVSQTGMEQLSLRLWRDGRYTAQMRVDGSKSADAAGLAQAGLARQGEDYVLTLEGKM